MVDLKGEYLMHFLCLNDLVSLGAVCILFFTDLNQFFCVDVSVTQDGKTKICIRN